MRASDLDDLTGLARFPLLILREVAALGVDSEALARRAGLSRSVLQDPDRRIPLALTAAVWKEILAALPGVPVGLRLGAVRKLREAGLVGYVMRHSGTLREALVRYARYARIVSEALHAELNTEPGVVRLVLEGHPVLDALRHPADSRLAWLLAATREVTGVPVVPVEVCFPYRPPDDLAEHRKFFGCPLRFEEKTAIVFRAQDLDLTVGGSDQTLGGYLERLAAEALASLGGEGSLPDRLRRALWSDLPGGAPNIGRAAERLGVSVRTLQRRLAAEKTSFAQVVEELRRDMAPHLLRERHLAICEVGFLLGYSEPSTFVRAFRRWHGTTPSCFRDEIARS